MSAGRKLSDDEIRTIITPLLFSGAKMLDRHCPVCGSPLFEKDGRVFCPVCESRKNAAEEGSGGESLRSARGSSDRVLGPLTDKLVELATAMPSNLDDLERHLRIMERILGVMEKYVRIRNAMGEDGHEG
ncbi:MAG: hypothetical protein GXO14_00480 [Thermococci archaeon]|nr:hypothetical protein [Thermococci archaeon]